MKMDCFYNSIPIFYSYAMNDCDSGNPYEKRNKTTRTIDTRVLSKRVILILPYKSFILLEVEINERCSHAFSK